MDPDEPYYSKMSRNDCNFHTLQTFGTIRGCASSKEHLCVFHANTDLVRAPTYSVCHEAEKLKADRFLDSDISR
jgi:hypothetical protein